MFYLTLSYRAVSAFKMRELRSDKVVALFRNVNMTGMPCIPRKYSSMIAWVPFMKQTSSNICVLGFSKVLNG